MANIMAGDRDKPVRFRFATGGTFDGTLATSARVFIKRQGSPTLFEWPVAIVAEQTTAALLVLVHTLAADGSDAPIPGRYTARAWAYQNGAYLGDTQPGRFPVDMPGIAWP